MMLGSDGDNFLIRSNLPWCDIAFSRGTQHRYVYAGDMRRMDLFKLSFDQVSFPKGMPQSHSSAACDMPMPIPRKLRRTHLGKNFSQLSMVGLNLDSTQTSALPGKVTHSDLEQVAPAN